MPQRINGSVFSDQVLTGSLRHYLLVGADFGNSFSDEAPVYGSAAEEVARIITQKATIAIFNPYEIGISFALESNRANWETEELEDAIRQLGNNVGTDHIDLSNIRLTEVEYKFLGSDYVFVVPDPTLNRLMVNNTYYVSASTTLTLPDYTQDIIDVGSILRIFKQKDSIVTIEAFDSQVINDLKYNTQDAVYTYDTNEEIVLVFDGVTWAVYTSDQIVIDDVVGLQDALDTKQNLAEKGQPNGYASLNNDGKVPSEQLPSYVDDVLEYPDLSSFPASGEQGKIYVDLSTERTYRWSGSNYVEISSRPANTDEVPEGTNNLYFTVDRARNSISSGTGVTYDSTSGLISIGQPVSTTDDVTFLSVTSDLQGNVTGNVTGQVSDISNHTTNELAEGTNNLYYTNSRVDDRIDLHKFKNIYYVDQSPVGEKEFPSINAALSYITQQGIVPAPNNQILILLGAGTFIEDPFVLPSWISLSGSQGATNIVANDQTSNFIVLEPNVYISDATIIGPTQPGTKMFSLSSNTGPGLISFYGVTFGESARYIDFVNNTANDITVLLRMSTVSGESSSELPWRVESQSTGRTSLIVDGFGHVINDLSSSIGHYIEVIGDRATATIANMIVDVIAGEVNHLYHLENGANVVLSSAQATGINTCIHVANVGAPSSIRATSLVSDALVNDVLIEHPNTTGTITGVLNTDKVSVNSNSVTVFITDPEDPENGQALSGEFYQGDRMDRLVNLSQLVRSGSTLGVVTGGEITVESGTNIIISAGNGYIEDINDSYVYELMWNETQITIPDNSERWIFVNSNGIAEASASPPSNFINFVLLGRVLAENNTIQFVEDIANRISHDNNRSSKFFRDAIGPLYVSGSIVSENSTDNMTIDISPGRYYYGVNEYDPSGGTSVTFTRVYRNGTGGFESGQETNIPNTWDNGTGSLQQLTSGYFVKHALYVVGEGANEHYYLVVGQSEFDNISVAEQADLPLPPVYINESFALIASIIISEGSSNITTILDERPVIGFKATGISASTTHGNLLGLTSDDHPQYLLADGTRSLTGDLNLNQHDLSDVRSVNGVTVESHADRHLPNGQDPLSTGTPETIGSTNQEGVLNSFARQDHVHNHGSQPGGSTHSTATQTVAGFMSATDKLLLDTINTDNVTEASNLYFTQERARDSISSGTGVTYNSLTGTISIGQSVDVDDDVVFNNVTANVTGQVSDISNHTTDELIEGSSNLYHTDERVDDRVSNLLSGTNDISLSYDDNANILTIGTTGTNDNIPSRLVKRSTDGTFASSAFDVDTSVSVSSGVGRFRWSEENSGPEVGLAGGTVNLQIGQELVQRVFNDTGFALTNGQVVKIDDSILNEITAAPAIADSNSTSETVLGVVTENIGDQETGFVTVFGKVRFVNTDAFNVGDDLYLSDTTAGDLVNIKPSAPNRVIYVGTVVRSHPTLGVIFVKISNDTTIAEASDVLLSNIQDDDILQWQTDKFVNVDGLSTFAPATHADNHLPNGTDPLATESAINISDNTSTEGSAESFARSDHTHRISSNTPSTGDILVWNGSNWVASDPITSVGLYSDYAELENTVTYASTIYANVLNLNVNLPVTGQYEVSWYMEARVDNRDEEVEFRINQDGSTTLGEFIHGRENNEFATYSVMCGFRQYQISSGQHTFSIDVRRLNNGTAFIRRVRLKINQVS